MDLLDSFKKEEEVDESIPAKGMFDFATKNRNRKVESLKDDRLSLQEDIDDKKVELRKYLLSLLKKEQQYLDDEFQLNKIKMQIKVADLERNTSYLENEVEDLEDKLENIKGDIEDRHEEIKEIWEDIHEDVESYNKTNRELFALTSSERYNSVYILSGHAIDVVKALVENEDVTNPYNLPEIIKEYILYP